MCGCLAGLFFNHGVVRPKLSNVGGRRMHLTVNIEGLEGRWVCRPSQKKVTHRWSSVSCQLWIYWASSRRNLTGNASETIFHLKYWTHKQHVPLNGFLRRDTNNIKMISVKCVVRDWDLCGRTENYSQWCWTVALSSNSFMQFKSSVSIMSFGRPIRLWLWVNILCLFKHL